MRRWGLIGDVAAVLSLVALLMVATTPPAFATLQEPLPVVSISPASGATIVAHAGVSFEFVSPIQHMTIFVTIGTQNATEPSGKLAFSEGWDPGIKGGEISPQRYGAATDSWWVPQPRTYYWQIEGFCYTFDGCAETHVYLSPVYTLVMTEATPPPETPTPQPPAPGAARAVYSKGEAVGDVARAIKAATHSKPHHLKRSCSRKSALAFSCKAGWFDRRYVWYGVMRLELNEAAGSISYRFTGLRASRNCLLHHSLRHCAHEASFHSS